MRVQIKSWLFTCSSSTCAAAAAAIETRPLSDSDTTPTSSSSNSSSNTFSPASLQSNLSLQTLPSVPSLQDLSLGSLNLAVSHLCLTTLKPSTLPITCLAVQGSLLYASSAHEINVYDRDQRQIESESSSFHLDAFNGRDCSSGSVKAVAFCDGKVFTAHQDCKIRVWQMTSSSSGSKRHKLLTSLPTVNDRLRRFALPKNYVNVRRHKKRLWIEHADAVTGLAVNNGLIYSVSWDKSLKIWRASDLRCLESVKAHEDAVNAVAVAADGTVYTGSADKRIRVWAPAGEKRHVLIATLEKHKSAVNALALNDDGSVLFSGSCDRSILVWEREGSANHMAVTGALRGHGKAVLSLFNVSDLLLSGSADRTVRIWQRGQEGRYCCLAVLEGHAKPVKSLVAVTDGDQSNGVVTVFSGGLDGEAKVWKVSFSGPDSSQYLIGK